MANFRQNFARFRLYRRRSLQENTRSAAFFQNLPDYSAEIFEIWQFFANFVTFAKYLLKFSQKLLILHTDFFAKILRLQRCKSMQIL